MLALRLVSLLEDLAPSGEDALEMSLLPSQPRSGAPAGVGTACSLLLSRDGMGG